MTDKLKPFADYLTAVQATLATGHASEGSHYPALKALLDSLDTGIAATSLPKHIECGAPDFIVKKGLLTVGYIEAKDIGKSLDDIERGIGPDGERFSRYLASLNNLVLTEYLEFRWYTDGERQLPPARLGILAKDGKINRDKAGIQAVAELLGNFIAHEAEGVGTPKELARHMARLAHRIREGVEEALAKGVASDLLSGLYKAFQETLIPGLEVKAFADMYAQTIAYGLFAARCETDNAGEFSREKAAALIPKTNPFLRDLFYQITGPTLDEEPYKWAVDELVQLLKKANMAEILKGFGKGTGKDDPVVYFYEDFLREYDKKISDMRGVYYTPIPVVSYIVRSIDYLLKNTFGRPQGLADESTYILDPATGTGTFLYAVINEIYESMTRQGQLGQWDGYVAEHLLPRIFGFEILMTPYVIAHLKLGLQLKDTRYKFQANKRLGVYLTNTLEKAVKSSEMLLAQYIVKEANAAAEIKKEKKIMVVLGNPPYSGNSANKGKWITQLIEDYKQVDGKPLKEKNPKALQDDYVKFIRFGQWRIDKTGQGILVFITNHTYLDNPIFCGMRQSLINTFDEIYLIDLHGNVRKKEVCPDGSKDENVFDIQQGVAIGIFVKETETGNSAKIYHAGIWGKRETKYQALAEMDISSTQWVQSKPCSPFYFFVPREEKSRLEYERCWKANDVFPVNSDGVKTHRDHFVVDFNESALKERILTFRETTLSDDDICYRFGLAEREAWSIADARNSVREDKDWEGRFRKYLYRPFDIRHIFYHESLIDRTRTNIMRHMLSGQNLAICVGRAGQVVGPETWDILFCSNLIEDCNLFYRGGTVNLPLYLYPAAGEMQLEAGQRRPNLNPDFIKVVSEKLKLDFVEDSKGDLEKTFGPEDIFNYAYAVFHSPTYRTRYAEFLKIDFPRLPLTSDKGLFKALAAKGAELVSLHLMESLMLKNLITKYPIAGSNKVEKVSYDEKTQRVHINKAQYFEGIPPEVWGFHIGGYQVAQKWLKDRKGRTLSYDDLSHYQQAMVALKETIRLMAEIDQLIPGWPLD